MRAADGCEADAGTGAVESPGADVASRAAAEDGADGTAAQRGTKGRALRFIASSGTLHRLAGGVCDLVFLRSSYFMCEGSNSQMLLPPPPPIGAGFAPVWRSTAQLSTYVLLSVRFLYSIHE